MPDGEATARVVTIDEGVETFSAPVRFDITSRPLPLQTLATALMEPVSPGEWTERASDHEVEFEITRADRIEVEFRQGDLVFITETTGPLRRHVRVPDAIASGSVSVRTRTWLAQVASDWSAASDLPVLEQKASSVIADEP